MRIPLLVATIVLGAITVPTPPLEAAPRNVAIVVYDNAEILDFAGPTEVLAAAGSFASEGGKSALNLYLVARTKDPIKAQGFVTIVPTYSIDDAPKPDFVVIPGAMSSNLSLEALKKASAAGITRAQAAGDPDLVSIKDQIAKL